MKSMLMKAEQVSKDSTTLDVEHLNRMAILEMMGSDASALEEKWENLAGDEFDDSGIYSPDEVGLGNWFASGYDD